MICCNNKNECKYKGRRNKAKKAVSKVMIEKAEEGLDELNNCLDGVPVAGWPQKMGAGPTFQWAGKS